MTAPKIIAGPVEQPPDYWCDDYTDEDTGEFVPGHMVDMSNIRRQTFETDGCMCGNVHALTVDFWAGVLDYPPLHAKLIEQTSTALRRRITQNHAPLS